MPESKRVVVVTGGSKGIGRAICLRFAREGARIVFLHYDPDDVAADETLKLLQDRGIEARTKKLDVSSFADVEEFFREVVEEFQGLDVLVNNSGITRDALFLRMSEDQWDQALSVNLKGAFNCAKAAVRFMVKQRSGRIISISSVVGQIGNIGQANYAASKAGIMGFTKSIARELATRGITANAVAPGFINTEMTRNLPEKARDFFLNQIPMGRVGEPEEVAEVVYWLASEGASYITGQVIHVNGGLYM
ncbi:MAG: 3-oxoacyl-[acyl-carrier-protein] reductase [Deltaproteobacteria bacterium]|nr:3-oxoacyl-[acyl-carrier-protein] reductase [Deltaproteobacteria bacterium]MBW2076546.1 3-oxoacyl-[acyl-carrier-protein] reductase [Deltaproteobacteria bacterium]MBW2310202.1 3-oxoacyl-[acyl-carrier-protein] reductase [Deltaproteobacteria bacterium]